MDRWVDIDASVVEYHRGREEEREIEDPGDAAHDKYLIKRFYCGSRIGRGRKVASIGPLGIALALAACCMAIRSQLSTTKWAGI